MENRNVKKAPRNAVMMTRRISVVIRSYSQRDDVVQLIEVLSHQSVRPLEIVVIDSGSAQWLRQKLRRLAGISSENGRVPVRLIEIPHSEYQSAGTLNRAIDHTHGDFIAIISQDALPCDKHYLERLVSAFDSNNTAGVYGRQILNSIYSPFGEKDLFKTYPPYSRIQKTPDCWFVNTCSMVRRDLWRRHPFDEQAVISEDHEWAKWAQQNGYLIKYEAGAVVQHYHHYKRLLELWGRFFLEGKGLAYVHKRRLSLTYTLFCYMRELVTDALWLARRGMPWYLPAGVVRRAVKYAALYWGHRMGAVNSGNGRNPAF